MGWGKVRSASGGPHRLTQLHARSVASPGYPCFTMVSSWEKRFPRVWTCLSKISLGLVSILPTHVGVKVGSAADASARTDHTCQQFIVGRMLKAPGKGLASPIPDGDNNHNHPGRVSTNVNLVGMGWSCSYRTKHDGKDLECMVRDRQE